MQRIQSLSTRLSLVLFVLATLLNLHLALSGPLPASSPAASPDPPTLTSLEIVKPTSLILDPAFHPTTFSYSLRSPTLLSTFSLVSRTGAANSVQLRLNDGPFFHVSAGDKEEVELLEGVNHVFVQTVNEDTRETVTYLITVCNGVNCHQRAPADTSSTQLLSLSIPSVNLTPAFSSTTFVYTAQTTRHTHGVIVVPTLVQAGEQLVVSSLNGEIFTAIEPLQRSHAQPMRMGANFLFVQVRDEQQQVATYTFVIERLLDGSDHRKSSEARNNEIEYNGGLAYIRNKQASAELSSLISSAGLLTPRFAPDVKAYSMAVDYHTPSMTLIANTLDTDAKLTLSYTWSISSSPQPTQVAMESKMMSAPIELCVGKTTVRVSVTGFDGKQSEVYSIVVHRESEAEESEGGGELQTSHATNRNAGHSVHHAKQASSAHDDPQLVGVRDQQYTVHVEEGQVYNIITEPHLLVNARYVNLPAPNENGKPAGDTVLGIAEIGLKTRTGHQLYLQTGAGEAVTTGFSRVSLNQQVMNVDDQAHIDNTEESTHEDGSSPATQANTELLAYNTSTTFTVITPTWYITFTDTETGIQPMAVLHSVIDIAAHGLIGQTWRDKRTGRLHEHGEAGRGGVGARREEGQEGSMPVLEGSIEDYRVKDGLLYSSFCEFNLYESEGSEVISEEPAE